MNIAYLNLIDRSCIYGFIDQLEKELDEREQKYLQDMRDVHANGYLSRKEHMAQMIKIATDYSVKKELIEEQIEWLLCNLK